MITAFDAIHDQVYPDRVLKEIANALDPDGTFLMQDIAASSHVHKNIDHPVGRRKGPGNASRGRLYKNRRQKASP